MKICSSIVKSGAVLAGFCFFLIGSEVRAQQLWGPANAGMTVDQVRDAIPSAYAPKEPNTLGTIFKSREELRIDNLSMEEQPFQAHFYFDEDKLVQVTLSYKGDADFEAILPVYAAFNSAFRREYGLETGKQSNYVDQFRSESSSFATSGTYINNSLTSSGESFLVWNINFQALAHKKQVESFSALARRFANMQTRVVSGRLYFRSEKHDRWFDEGGFAAPCSEAFPLNCETEKKEDLATAYLDGETNPLHIACVRKRLNGAKEVAQMDRDFGGNEPWFIPTKGLWECKCYGERVSSWPESEQQRAANAFRDNPNIHAWALKNFHRLSYALHGCRE